MDRLLSREGLDYLVRLSNKIGQDNVEVYGVDVEYFDDLRPIRFRLVTEHINYKNKWINWPKSY